MSNRFAGKVVIVTGSSSGIGAETALQFAKEGAKVTITGRKKEGLQATLDAIISAGIPAANVNVVSADVTSEEGQNAIVNSTVEKFGKIDILVNNAGAAIPDAEGKTGLLASVDTFNKTISLNVTSVISLVQKTRPYIVASKGEIINIGSICGKAFEFSEVTYYAMAKAALDSLTRSLAYELVSDGVRVNGVSPGVVRTNFAQAMGLPEAAADKHYDLWELEKIYVPIGKCGQSLDIANLILFLADRKLSFYIVGQCIVADGGSTLVLGFKSLDIAKMMNS